MNAKEIRLECVKISAQKLSPNEDFNGLLAHAEDIYNFITTGVRHENVVAKS